jgi:hypothetical protein
MYLLSDGSFLEIEDTKDIMEGMMTHGLDLMVRRSFTICMSIKAMADYSGTESRCYQRGVPSYEACGRQFQEVRQRRRLQEGLRR